MIISIFKSVCCKADVSEKKNNPVCDECKKPCATELMCEKHSLEAHLKEKQVSDENRQV